MAFDRSFLILATFAGGENLLGVATDFSMGPFSANLSLG